MLFLREFRFLHEKSTFSKASRPSILMKIQDNQPRSIQKGKMNKNDNSIRRKYHSCTNYSNLEMEAK